MTLPEVKAAAHRGENTAGKISYWFQPKAYAQADYLEAWNRLGSPELQGFPAQAEI
jgi:hypothetical protein